ncbi:energy-coupling factor transporter transmembrane component T family protein [Treponema primitia]|uniref:energy-coupling factor transporter transmembrane component T family protein n=1 Tax=Treponema primitia TaxID=88058 RepID=UPI000255515E|nr:energy-coupling factor transporter transmembrane component T [Treponema primitia]
MAVKHRPIRRPVPYAYRPGNSILHRLPGGLKLLGLFLVSTLSFIFGLSALGLGTLLVIAASLAAKIRPWELLRGIRPLLVMALMVGLCRSVGLDPERESVVFLNTEGLEASIIFGWGIILAFCAASLFFSVTTMTEIKDSLDHLHLRRLSLGISLMLGFLPRFFTVWESAELAYRARCGKKGLTQLLTLIPLVMERMIVSAGETASALESRGCLL